jgi:ABC-2 type transport system permease protein
MIRVSLTAIPRRGRPLAAKAVVLAGGAIWRSAGDAALYLALVALLGPGVTTVVRDSAAAVGIVLGLLYQCPQAWIA